jgi:hypothetical protein
MVSIQNVVIKTWNQYSSLSRKISGWFGVLSGLSSRGTLNKARAKPDYQDTCFQLLGLSNTINCWIGRARAKSCSNHHAGVSSVAPLSLPEESSERLADRPEVWVSCWVSGLQSARQKRGCLHVFVNDAPRNRTPALSDLSTTAKPTVLHPITLLPNYRFLQRVLLPAVNHSFKHAILSLSERNQTGNKSDVCWTRPTRSDAVVNLPNHDTHSHTHKWSIDDMIFTPPPLPNPLSK